MKIFFPFLIALSFISGCSQSSEEEITNRVEFDNTEQMEQISSLFEFGIDISHHQNDQLDSISKQTDTLSFIICKATEGLTYVDPKFSKNWKTAKEKSYVRGVYHFYRSNDDPIKQASFFLSMISDLAVTDLPPVLDFEEGGIDKTQSVEEIQMGVKKFLLEIESKTTAKPIIYTDINTGNKYLNDPFFENYPLWIANYNGKKKPNLPEAWKNKGWLFWQSSDSYTLGSTSDDFDKFNGNFIELKQFIKDSYKPQVSE